MGSYSAAAAKTKAMFGKGLGQENFDDLLSKKSVKEVFLYLKNETGYADVFFGLSENNVHRGVIEARLRLMIENEYKRLYGFMDKNGKAILDFWFYRREISYIKHHIRKLYNNAHEAAAPDPEDMSEFFVKNTRIDTVLINEAKDMADYAAACEKTPYAAFLKRAGNIGLDYFSVAMGLDSMFYAAYWKAIKKLPQRAKKGMEKLVGKEIDMLNIIWIYRSKHYFKSNEELIYTNLLPVRYRLGEDDIKRMASAQGGEGVVAEAMKTTYRKLFSNISEGFYVDENYRRRMQKTAGSVFRAYDDTVAAVAAYLDLKQIEVLNIIRVIEGIRYGIGADAIKKHIKLI